MIFSDSEIEELIKAEVFVDKREYSTDELWTIINKTNRKIISKELYDNIWFNVFGPPTSIRWATPEQRKMWPPEIKKEDIVKCPRCRGKLKILKDDNEEEYYKCEICQYASYIIQAEKKDK